MSFKSKDPKIDPKEVEKKENTVKTVEPEALKDIFAQDYFVSGSKSSYDDYSNCEGIVSDLATLVLRSLRTANIKPVSSFDAGCAYGFILSAFQNVGVDAHGSDPSEWAISKVKESLKNKVYVDSLPELKTITRQFDLVTCFETLEHIPFEKVEASLERLYLLVKPGGTLVILPGMCPEGHWCPKDPSDVTHVSLLPRSWWNKTVSDKKYSRNLVLEKKLNSDPLSQSVKWGECVEVPEGRFIVIQKPIGTITEAKTITVSDESNVVENKTNGSL